ncbi:MAG: TerC family protein [Parvibaculum sp.]|uniref:TerC family protein n=1 Tax=Parvibaculum sp. TaxID=2024848 RepID=UPI003C737F15
MEWIADPTIWIGLATLVVLEIVLGIDNLVFIAILADKLPPHQRDHARLTGLSLALIMRLALLASISWLVTLTAPLVTIYGFSVSGRDLIMLGGGIFLLAKATMELHERLEPPHESRNTAKVHAGFWLIVTQIIILDAVFSIDSVVTAVGMVDSLPVMMAAVIIAILVMMLASKPLTTFVNAHPTVVVLCLGFLMMIGFSLIADGFGFHIPKGYLYAAIGFSILIEAFNQWTQRNRAKQVAAMPFRQRTAEAIFRLLGGSVEDGEAGSGNGATEAEGRVFGAEERSMVSGVLMLGERPVSSIMTPRREIVWVSLADDPEKLLDILRNSPHGLYPVCRTSVDDLVGYARAKDLMEDLLTRGAIDEARSIREPLVVHEGLGVLKLLDMFRLTRVQLAFITDEYGGIQGLVTSTDMLEAIAGEFPDDEDGEHWLTKIGDGHWRVEGWSDVRHLSVAIGRDLATQGDNYSTIAGYVMWYLGRLPELGDRLERDDLAFTVTKMEGRRIAELEIEDCPSRNGD